MQLPPAVLAAQRPGWSRSHTWLEGQVGFLSEHARDASGAASLPPVPAASLPPVPAPPLPDAPPDPASPGDPLDGSFPHEAAMNPNPNSIATILKNACGRRMFPRSSKTRAQSEDRSPADYQVVQLGNLRWAGRTCQQSVVKTFADGCSPLATRVFLS